MTESLLTEEKLLSAVNKDGIAIFTEEEAKLILEIQETAKKFDEICHILHHEKIWLDKNWTQRGTEITVDEFDKKEYTIKYLDNLLERVENAQGVF